MGGHGVRGDHPPASGRGQDQDTVPARQGLGGQGGCRLEGRLDGGRPDHPGLAGHAVEHSVVGGQGTGVGGGGPLATAGGAALDDHYGHPGGYRPDSLEEISAVVQALHVAEPDVGFRIVSEPLQVVGDTSGCRVAGRHRATQADARLVGVVLEGRHKVAGLRRDTDPTAGRKGGHDLGAQADRW